jgi:hypothetical protein
MKTALIVLGLSGVIAITLGTLSNLTSINKSQPQEEEGTLLWYVKMAKDKGQKEITLPASVVDYAGSSRSTTLDKTLFLYDGVIATPVKRFTAPFSADEIITWYKFKTTERLSSTDKAKVSESDSSPPPEQLLPIAADEFVIAQLGGTLMLNGVKLTKIPEYAPFEIDKQYLMFIRRQPSGKGEIVGGPIGAFAISDSESITPLSNRDHPLIKTLKDNYGNSLSRFRRAEILKSVPR